MTQEVSTSSSRRGGRVAGAVLSLLAVGAAAGVAVVAPDVVHQLEQNPRDRVETASLVPDPVTGVVTTTPAELPVATNLEDAVYVITVDDCGLMGTGSGFAIDAHHVVTNAHVVQADPNPQLRSPSGERFVGRVIGVHGADDGDGVVDFDGLADVAVIEVDVALPARLAWAPRPPDVGQRLTGLTFPQGAFAPTQGTVVSDHAQGFEIRGDFDRGSSGGPVMSEAGEVYGIITAGQDGGGRAFAFDVAVLKPIVDGMLANPQALPADCRHA